MKRVLNLEPDRPKNKNKKTKLRWKKRRLFSSGKCQVRTEGGWRRASSRILKAEWSAVTQEPERPAATAAGPFN